MERFGRIFLLSLTALVAITAALLIEQRPMPRQSTRAEFQRLVGGLGFGAASADSAGAYRFEPRLEVDDVAPD